MVAARVICLEVLPPPPVNSDGHVPGNNIDGVEALLLFPDPRRSRGSSLHYENAAGTSDEIARVVARGMMSMPGKHHVDANLLHSVEREIPRLRAVRVVLPAKWESARRMCSASIWARLIVSE